MNGSNDSSNNTASTFPDLNGNGVPDYKESWLYRLGLSLLVREIKKHPHTLAAKAIAELEKLLGK